MIRHDKQWQNFIILLTSDHNSLSKMTFTMCQIILINTLQGAFFHKLINIINLYSRSRHENVSSQRTRLIQSQYKFMAKGKLQVPQKSVFGIDFQSLFDSLSKFLPHLIQSPIRLMNFVLKCFNQLTEVTLFIILIGQTVHILHSNEKRYINLRHILIKWIIYLMLLLLVEQVKHHTIFDQLFILLCNSFAFVMVYPSKFIKNLHLKYFSYSQKKKYDETLDDPTTLDLALTTKILVSVSIVFLNISRFLITFIPLNQRRKIEEALKQVNLTIVEQKYFGKIYDSKWNKNNQAINQLTQSQGNDNNFTKSYRSSKAERKSQKQKNDNSIKMKVEEHIQINLGSIISSQAGNRKFAFYRNIDINYNVQTTQLTIINQDDGRTTVQILAEIVIIDDLMLHLIFEDEQEPMFVKFKSKKDKELFINYIYLES